MSNVRDVGYFESHGAYQTQRDFRNYFWRVIKGYKDVCELSPLVAAVLDPNETPKKLGADGIIYICDIEIATRRALDNNYELLDQWQRLVNGENTPNSASIINKCGRMYCRRRLAPATYLRFVKKGRRDRRRIVN
jgi:hypothetical protein